jgi:formylglycine-generating enzyme required for sulfatase activity
LRSFGFLFKSSLFFFVFKVKYFFRVMMKKTNKNQMNLTAAEALCYIDASKRDKREVLLTCELLYQIINSDAVLKERFQAGVLVGKLGDTRFSEDNDNMVTVPAGEFTRGSDRFDNTMPVRRIVLDSFKIGVYPVNNWEFKRFIDDGGYKKEEYWTPEGWQWRNNGPINAPHYLNYPQFNGPNFPVVGISWYEAVAYSNWLSKVTGKPYHLPTEAEWEKAARGTDGQEYPWGNTFDKNFCNSDQSGLGQSSPVGIFLIGKSPYGCLDMAGNVYEWCVDWYGSEYYEDSPFKNPTGPQRGSYRLLRGGCWLSGPGSCSTTFRIYSSPAHYISTVGFRLACSL